MSTCSFLLYLTSQRLHQAVVLPPAAVSSTRIVLIDQPLHRFHSDHWYHVGEYYISQQHVLYGLGGNGDSDGRTVVLVGNRDPKFMKKLTKTVLFYITASFGGRFDVVEVVAHDQLDGLFGEYRGTWASTLDAAMYRLRTTFNSVERRAVARFDVRRPLDRRFEFIPTQPYVAILGRRTELGHSRGVGTEAAAASRIKSTSPSSFNSSGDNRGGATRRQPSSFLKIGRHPVSSDGWFRSDEEAARMRHTIRWMCRSAPDAEGGGRAVRLEDLRAAQPGVFVSRASGGVLLPLTPRGGEAEPSEAGTTSSSRSGLGQRRRHRIVLYERDSNRHFKDLDRVVSRLARGAGNAADAGRGWDIDLVYHHDDMHPCLLHLALHDADVFLTTHGFQALALLFLKPGAVLIEIFPYKYFKPSYLKLSGTYGVHHRWRQNASPTSLTHAALRLVPQATCMRHRRCRSHARGDSVVMTDDDVAFVINVTRDVEAGRLGAHNAPRHPFIDRANGTAAKGIYG